MSDRGLLLELDAAELEEAKLGGRSLVISRRGVELPPGGATAITFPQLPTGYELRAMQLDIEPAGTWTVRWFFRLRA